jgi:uncharacterized protein (DUF2141 family)
MFLGVAEYGIERPDVAQWYGERTRKSGFSLTVRGLPPGTYQVVAFAYSSVTWTFSQARAAMVTVAPDPRIVIDTPAPGAVTLPATLAGWVLDASADGGTGIDAVHVWAYPADGTPAIFAGAATYGLARPDVAAAFGGNALFTNSGYSLRLQHLNPGKYNVVVFAHRIGAPSFDVVKVITLDVIGSQQQFMALDAPAEGENVGPSFTVAGWASDLGAASGSGVDTVHVWAYPDTGPAIFLGAAQYGMERPDVAQYIGESARYSAFSLAVTGLAPGTYRLVVFAHSSVTGAFDQSRTRVVTVSGAPR